MVASGNSIGWLTASGTPFDIGLAAGLQGRSAVRRHLLSSQIWAQITDEIHGDTVEPLIALTQARFPQIWAEMRGLSEGLDLPLEDVFAWNCRGDILASVPDGCTTIQQPGPAINIAHNEDGLPFFRGECFVLDAQPDDQPGFRAFCYPGSIPGHTFGWNDAGLVQTVNNLRLKGVRAKIPRMVLARAVLASRKIDSAVEILRQSGVSGGFI